MSLRIHRFIGVFSRCRTLKSGRNRKTRWRRSGRCSPQKPVGQCLFPRVGGPASRAGGAATPNTNNNDYRGSFGVDVLASTPSGVLDSWEEAAASGATFGAKHIFCPSQCWPHQHNPSALIRQVPVPQQRVSSCIVVSYALGKVTPTCPWYLPPRSLYEVSHTSSLSLSKNSTWAQPSPA